MTSKIRLALVCAAMASAGLSSASGLSVKGEFTTRVAEDRLFVDESRVLRCDLFFSVPGREAVIAPKGSELRQSLPPIVWQYSALLPVSDYLKSAAIHSVSSEARDRSWQDVQHNFYDGLLVEGANSMDAKIAYAGAYAFAPRWPFVDFVEVKETEQKYPETILYNVEYTQPKIKGMSVEGYRALSLEILRQPEDISLQDIQAVINASDFGETKTRERASLGGIGGVESGSKTMVTGNDNTVITTIATVPVSKALTASREAKELEAKESVAMDENEEQEGLVKGMATAVTGGIASMVKSDAEKQAKEGGESSSDAKKSLRKEAMANLPATAPEAGLAAGVVTKGVVDVADFGGEIFNVSEAEVPEAEVPVAEISEADEVAEADEEKALMSKTQGLGIDDAAKEPLVNRDESMQSAGSVVAERRLQSAEIVKLPADGLFYSDSDVSDEAVDADIRESVPMEEGALVDLTVLNVESDSKIEEAESEVMKVVGGDAMEEFIGPDEEWIILPDGTSVLRSVSELVSE